MEKQRQDTCDKKVTRSSEGINRDGQSLEWKLEYVNGEYSKDTLSSTDNSSKVLTRIKLFDNR